MRSGEGRCEVGGGGKGRRRLNIYPHIFSLTRFLLDMTVLCKVGRQKAEVEVVALSKP